MFGNEILRREISNNDGASLKKVSDDRKPTLQSLMDLNIEVAAQIRKQLVRRIYKGDGCEAL